MNIWHAIRNNSFKCVQIPDYCSKIMEDGQIFNNGSARKCAILAVGFLISIIFLLYSASNGQLLFLLQKTTADYFVKENYTWLDEYKQYIDQKQRQFEYLNQWLVYDPRESVEPQFDRFIYTHEMHGGLGNQLYRFASLYAMGQMLNRTPVFMNNDYKVQEMRAELAIGFPEFYRRIYFLKSNLKESDIEKVTSFDKTCCDFVDPKILFEHNQKRFLMLNGPNGNFENSKYFHPIRPQIVRLFSFGPQIRDNVAASMEQIFKGDDLFKFCVHTRNGDFTGFGVSKAEQVGPAIDRIIQQLPRIMKKSIGNFSMVLFGEDGQLLHSLKFNKEAVYKMYYIADVKMGRIEELHLAQRTCQLFLDTASLSSFAFWMGYLMPDDVPIFFIRKNVLEASTNTLDTLPLEWFPIEEDWLKNDT